MLSVLACSGEGCSDEKQKFEVIRWEGGSDHRQRGRHKDMAAEWQRGSVSCYCYGYQGRGRGRVLKTKLTD